VAHSYAGYNKFTNNDSGIFAYATGDSYQYVDLHYGNDFNGNSSDYAIDWSAAGGYIYVKYGP
jgi:hypothetical protein